MMVSIARNQLADALQLGPRELVALIGGGGKTTSLVTLGSALPGRVVLTTTTKLGRDQLGSFPTLDDPSDSAMREELMGGQIVVRQWADDHKSMGVTPQRCDAWFADETLVDYVVVEADGARGFPFKAPRRFEPVIPSTATMVLAHIGSDALDRVIADQCHRPLRVAAAAGCSPYERLTPKRAANVLLSERGSRKGVPTGARFVVVVTKVDASNRRAVESLAEEIDERAEVLAIKDVSNRC